MASPLQSRLQETISLVKKGVDNNDDSYLYRALRRTAWIRKQPIGDVKACFKGLLHLTAPVVAQSVDELFPVDSMEVDAAAAAVPEEEKKSEEMYPEVELYLHHTAVHIARSRKTCGNDALFKSARLMMDRAKDQERRTMNVLRGRAWHSFSVIFESINKGLSDEVRQEILAAHRSACLHLDEVGQAVTINLILRDLVSRNLISEAVKFASKARFPDRASNNMQVRHLYYMGRVEALQLEYGKSLNLIQQAIRKTPTTCGKGFRLKLHALGTVVTLLTGETPERAWYSDPELGDALLPYFDLVNAVRVGNVHAFEQCIRMYHARFEKDRNFSLVQRLHSSVIKTGLKAIGAAYSRISFTDIARKLELETEDSSPAEAAFYLCAKAIRDGVLDASIDSDGAWMSSSDQVDIYSSTSDPQKAYQRRINFLTQVHNDAVKSLRYPPDAHKTTNRPAPTEREEADIEDIDENLAADED